MRAGPGPPPAPVSRAVRDTSSYRLHLRATTMSATDRDWTSVMLPDLPPPAGAYSPGVRAGNLLFVSGQTPRDQATGQIVGTTVEEQSRLTLTNLARILAVGGASLPNVV